MADSSEPLMYVMVREVGNADRPVVRRSLKNISARLREQEK
jgi:hypothetical protein